MVSNGGGKLAVPVKPQNRPKNAAMNVVVATPRMDSADHGVGGCEGVALVDAERAIPSTKIDEYMNIATGN